MSSGRGYEQARCLPIFCKDQITIVETGRNTTNGVEDDARKNNIDISNGEVSDISDKHCKPSESYISLIATAILSSQDKRLVLSDIYDCVMAKYPYFKSQEKSWRNSIRHNLSLNDCFVKDGRSSLGKGQYWAIHPENYDEFCKGDFRRRRAKRNNRRKMFCRSMSVSKISSMNLREVTSTNFETSHRCGRVSYINLNTHMYKCDNIPTASYCKSPNALNTKYDIPTATYCKSPNALNNQRHIPKMISNIKAENINEHAMKSKNFSTFTIDHILGRTENDTSMDPTVANQCNNYIYRTINDGTFPFFNNNTFFKRDFISL